MRLNKDVISAGSRLLALQNTGDIESTGNRKHYHAIRTSQNAAQQIEPLMEKVATVAPDHVNTLKEELIQQTKRTVTAAKTRLADARKGHAIYRRSEYRRLRELHKKYARIKITADDISNILRGLGNSSARDVSLHKGVVQWTMDVKKLGVIRTLTININTHTNTAHITDGQQHARRTTQCAMIYSSRTTLLEYLTTMIQWAVNIGIGGQPATPVVTITTPADRNAIIYNDIEIRAGNAFMAYPPQPVMDIPRAPTAARDE